ncbi:hypothetical protein HYALB_00005733 [Hymenoscyphus albidus]|uniref:MalT-like TPR region domain-containing protein n=1 Tax=Hymenoscyphus albidus TaxID=595503 RepID=A0A9N9LRQ3_9HELO|nr:hypothetical protein HYALB_00005733 [Hymenoscyphus albidus]
MHPLVHEWSRDRLSHEQRYEVWRNTIHLMAGAAHHMENHFRVTSMKPLLTHVEEGLSQGRYQLFSNGPELSQRVGAALIFCRLFRYFNRASSIEFSQGALKCIQTKLPGDCNYFPAILEIGAGLQSNGRYKEAISLNLQATKEAEEAVERPVSDNQDAVRNQKSAASNTAMLMVNLARAYTHDQQNQRSIKICEKLTEVYTPMLGENSFEVRSTLPILAHAYRDLGDLKRARKYLEKSIEDERKLFGEDYQSPEVRQLAEVYIDLKMFKKARALQSQVVSWAQERYEEDDIDLVLEESILQLYQPTGRSVLSGHRKLRERIEGYKKSLKGILEKGGT